MESTSHDPRLRTLVPAGVVRDRIEALHRDLAEHYRDARVLLVVVEQGAKRFAGSLLRGLEGRVAGVDVTALRARRTEGTALREVRLTGVEEGIFRDRDVLVVDDIIDEGRTLRAVVDRIRSENPRSLRTAVLVNKTAARREPIVPDFAGFEIDRGWIVGYGMDLDGRYRELDHLAVYEPNKES